MITITDIDSSQTQLFFDMCKEFYNSNAVMHTIPDDYIAKTAAELSSNNPFMRGLALTLDGQMVGYALLAFSYSNEAGGMVLWLDEIYIRADFRGQGIGKFFFNWLFNEYNNKISRYRLEVSSDNISVCNMYKNVGFDTLPYLQMIIEK